MRKKMFFCVIVMIIAVVSISYMHTDRRMSSDLMLKNVEALADEESGVVLCWGSGSVVCPISQSKVGFVRERSLWY